MQRSISITFGIGILLALGACKDRASPTAAPAANQSQPTPVPAGNVVRTPEAVKESFSRFVAAAKARRGAEAEKLVDSETVRTYARTRDLALNATRDQLKKDTFATRLAVIEVRATMSRSQLEAVAPDAFFANSVEKGWVGASPFDLVDIKITGDTALAGVSIGGSPPSIFVPFVAEEGTWRFKYSEFAKMAADGSQQIAQRSKKSEDDWIVGAAGKSAGKELPDSIWDPMK